MVTYLSNNSKNIISELYDINIKYIIKIQKFLRQCIVSKLKDNKNVVDLILRNIKQNNAEHNILFIKCYKILQKYPPAKNEYKFIYGILVQKSVIEMLNNIFIGCIDLDDSISVGSEYKNDCILHITPYIQKNISIKAKKNRKSNIIIINKNSNDKKYDLSDLITLIVIIELKDILIIPHNIVPSKFILDNKANISYKSSLFTYLYKIQDYKKYILHLEENENYKNFYKNEYPNIAPHNIYKELYNKL